MYIGFGYSSRSEKDAFNKAIKMVKEMGVKINSISLDKYYSTRRTLRMFGKETAVYIIPKKNMSRIGFEWLRVIERIVQATCRFLKRYFKRNLSESGFSADKRRFGVIRQKREDRRDSFICCWALAQCFRNQGEVILSQFRLHLFSLYIIGANVIGY